ncbi:MAG: PilZ domain-containing protein [Desulfobacterales bacterium]
MDYLRNLSAGASTGDREDGGSKNPARRRLIDTDFENDSLPEPTTISKNRLVNTLNLRHFRNETIRVYFRHARDERKLYFDAIPQPCFGKYLVCLWRNPPGPLPHLDNYRFAGLFFSSGIEYIQVSAICRAISAKGICVRLPEKAESQSSRLWIRHSCQSVNARLLQNGIMFEGMLKDFNASAFCVTLSPVNDPPYQWINIEQNLILILAANGQTLYSGECRITRNTRDLHENQLVIKPVSHLIQRFTPRVYRSKRVPVSPPPDIALRHPLTGGLVNLKAIDISGSGISVEENPQNAMLVAGLLLPEMNIYFASAFKIRCKAQVVYTRNFTTVHGGEKIQCGIVFLDMDPNDHMRLLSMIHQVENQHLYICNPVDIDSLWAFFFETGFIYPKKYAFIRQFKEEVKKTYEKLYTCQSSIARHFTWQQNGAIIAHLAMLRFYEKTWLIQHLASKTEKRFGTGTDMVEQIGAFTYDTHRLASSHMSYLICYYRPDNRFPAHFFGGVAEKINDPRACSVDDFAYFHTRLEKNKKPLAPQWDLSRAEPGDLYELRQSYDQHSGGLMLRALDLVPENMDGPKSDLSDLYQEMGLWRERRVFALKQEAQVKAVIMANVADFALNLSDLTNCINLFVIDEQTPYEVLQQSISVVGQYYSAAKVPVLIYPLTYARKSGRAFDRVYRLWALDMQYTDEFFKNYNALK